MRKKVDDRIRTLIENGVRLRHRSMFVIVGDKYRDQIVNLHYMLSKALIKSQPTVLWCYKDKLDLSSHKKKRAKQIKKLMQRGLLDPEKVDPFSLFVESGKISYCLYKDSERVLGNTFGMCILQDFESLTPNLLARTIETVEGGGLIVLLIRSLQSLTELYTMTMDVHKRLRTEAHSDTVARFNERFLLSIASCKACLVMDDELNILPISSHVRSIKPVLVMEDSEGLSKKERELKDLKEKLHDIFPHGPLVSKCFTKDQGKAVAAFLTAIFDKNLQGTVALTAARGRGKSAALGLAIAGAVAAGFSNIFVTAPSPENLKTLFEFVCKGLNALEYKEHFDYDVMKSSDPIMKKATIQINIHKQHRQTIQYMKPHEHGKLSQVELLVVDEAAAIPLPIVKSLLGPYLVFLSSTVNGYEGTGRSLSLKLLQQLKSESQMAVHSSDCSHSGRLFNKLELNEAIRYAPGDPVETWLNELLCLNAANYIPSLNKLPPTSECNLYYVNRDTLFSFHKESELFLQRMMALYVASHYKNSPNDLQLMADAPSHHLFVLLGPVDESTNTLPEILCVLQVCLEGQISRNSALQSLSKGHQPFGDQIPWKVYEQFQDDKFPTLSGCRIVRIAVHPTALNGGYGSTAVELLSRYYEGQFADFTEIDEEIEKHEVKVAEAAQKASLLKEKIVPKANLPPLLVRLRERHPEKLHYIGVSFGLTHDLFRFWRKNSFTPFYIGHIPSPVTGEHTCMVLKPLNNDEFGIDTESYFQDFKQRFLRLLGSRFNSLDYKLAMSILAPKIDFTDQDKTMIAADDGLRTLLTARDLKRLESYTNNRVDYYMILDLLPVLAHQYFQGKIPVALTAVQASVLFFMGLQIKDIGHIKEQMKLEREQILSSFIEVMRKLYSYLYSMATKEINETLPRINEAEMAPHSKSLDEELANRVLEKWKETSSDGIFIPEHLQQYAIDDNGEFERTLQTGGIKLSSSGIISVKSSRTQLAKQGAHGHSETIKSKRRGGKDGDKSRSNKKKKT